MLTKLHAGGKFGGEGYKVSGGLHGVGVSVVNALSSRFESRSTATASATASSSTTAASPRQARRSSATRPRGRTGTTVTFWPDPTVFETTEFRAQALLERLQMMAFLNKGLEIRFNDQRPEHEHEQVDVQVRRRHHRLRQARQRDEGGAVHEGRLLRAGRGRTRRSRSRSSGTPATTDGLHSFANGIATIEGGMHEEGFKKALTNVVNKYARAKNLLKEKDENLARRGHPRGPHRHHLGAPARPAVRGPDQGQARQRLDALAGRAGHQRASSAEWLEENPTEANKIVKKAIAASQARMAAKKARDAIRRKSALDGAGMPDKLKDCASRNPDERELFIVEGDSAGGSARQGPRPAHAGDPADPRQDPQRRAGPPRPDAEEQRDPGADLGHRRRRRRGVRRRRRSATTRSS